MTAVGALIGIDLALRALIFSAIIGGIMSIVVMVRHRALLETSRRMAVNMYLSAMLKQSIELSQGTKGVKFRYSPAIAAGTILAFIIKI
jgi:Flp pilus assembly protein protease CpaA